MIVAWAVSLLIPTISGFADSRVAPLDAPLTPPAASSSPAFAAPRVFARLSLGWMSTAPSEQRDLLSRDGFQLGTKYAGQLDASYMIGRWIGAGFWTGLTYQSADANGGHPSVSEKCAFAGVQVPFMWTTGDVALLAIPRFGAASAELYVHRSGSWTTGPVAGAEVGLFFARKLPGLGLSLGGLWAPVGDQGGVARAHNAGGIYFLVSGVLHE